jgi:D-alanyl-D-alanine dipeptidase
MQITYGLPLQKIKSVIVTDNNEPLVEIKETEKINLDKTNKNLIPQIRMSVLNLLTKASTDLPSEYKILVSTAFRPYEMQKRMWRKRLLQMAVLHPITMILNNRAWKKEAGRYTAPPGGSSHQCGAALDVTLLYKNSKVDMGSTQNDIGIKVHTFNKEINIEQKANREMLYKIMTEAGFANYPLEWWHYSYGDRMWAAYTEESEAFYGPIK